MKPIDPGTAPAEKLSPLAGLSSTSLDTVRYGIGRIKQSWYACLHWLCVRIYFDRVTAHHPEHLPESGPTLYVGLHRNGAVDGFVYQQVLPRAIFLISTQLRRSFLARLFFHGIAIARKSDDEDRSHNDEALHECLHLLNGGGELFVFPEGTSSLGPHHLSFKSGAARLALGALERGIPLRIIPIGIHYERAWAFRSEVEVVIGEPIATGFSADCSNLGRLKEMKRRIASALESVGANFPSTETQENAERIACVATLWTPCNYFSALKSLEAGASGSVLSHWQELAPQFAVPRMLLYQGFPAVPARAVAPLPDRVTRPRLHRPGRRAGQCAAPVSRLARGTQVCRRPERHCALANSHRVAGVHDLVRRRQRPARVLCRLEGRAGLHPSYWWSAEVFFPRHENRCRRLERIDPLGTRATSA
ncbi:phospholipid/glycerol acyltransferase [Chthoniobacter flavus Ellin428]|uniref:Phospholipid/glycerol acyltransferase n=1 Tax=Chthoniobacter flavus Ellin428 TaxID=497964 RepID=B4D374_9BACT|nr:1-acyl-sn-glycerol-3-phosphate acyltransferase [Chthoniobacter flavus]EDY19185.1 phospholipid/glycerol acyltransferase [Chthoniobacter flavus Ellin428]